MRVQKLVAELLKEAVKESLPFPLSTVLNYLVDEVAKDHDTIARLGQKVATLDRKLDQHIIASYKTGLVYLEEAQHAPTRSAEQRYLHDAQKEFIAATQIELPSYPMLPLKAHFYVGVCHDLLADTKNALRWYEKAHKLIVSYIRSHDQSRLNSEREEQMSHLEYELEELDDQLARLPIILDADSMVLVLKVDKLMGELGLPFKLGSQLDRAFNPKDLYELGKEQRKALAKLGPETQKMILARLEAERKKDVAWFERELRKERNLILSRLAEAENSQGPLYDLLNPDEHPPQTRRKKFLAIVEQEYFFDWELNRLEAEDVFAWAIDLTNLIATRRPRKITRRLH